METMALRTLSPCFLRRADAEKKEARNQREDGRGDEEDVIQLGAHGQNDCRSEKRAPRRDPWTLDAQQRGGNQRRERQSRFASRRHPWILRSPEQSVQDDAMERDDGERQRDPGDGPADAARVRLQLRVRVAVTDPRGTTVPE